MYIHVGSTCDILPDRCLQLTVLTKCIWQTLGRAEHLPDSPMEDTIGRKICEKFVKTGQQNVWNINSDFIVQ